MPQHQTPLNARKDAASSGAHAGKNCAICLDNIDGELTATLPCTHIFHSTCVADLRKFGVQQVCPLCRIPLSSGPEKVFEEATRRFTVVNQLVNRGYASWNTLPASAQRELDAAIIGWRTAANEGYASAQCNLGLMFDNGWGVAQDGVEAARLYKKSAEQGFAGAQLNLGNLFNKGRGVAQSDIEAVRWYRKAAEQGLAAAQFQLGIHFADGRGVAKNYAEAVQWYEKAADQGLAVAQSNLGEMFHHGVGVAQNDVEAVRWYEKATEQGNAMAQTALGCILFATGRGVARNDVEAARWFMKAAGQGMSVAQFSLGNKSNWA